MAESTEKWDPNTFWTGQDFQTSARLHLQHWIWQYQLGFALHPDIPLSKTEQTRIADIAAGNGAWVLELARALPMSRTKLEGFDITSSNFPHPDWLPPNVRFHTWDVFSEVPSEYIGVFDIVHIRAFYSCIKDNKVEPVLTNLLKLLKPGGYLQWDEGNASTLKCEVPNPEVKAEATETIVKIQNILSQYQSHLQPDWLRDLGDTLEANGCMCLAHQEYAPLNQLARAWNDNMLLVWRDLIPMLPETAMPLPPGIGLPETLSQESFAQLFAQAVEECAKGVMVGMTYHVVVAKKDVERVGDKS